MLSQAIPKNERELLQRAEALAGKTLGELAKIGGSPLPTSLSRAKGWIGQLIEKQLGAPGDNKPEPDFLNLGIELKTLPINLKGEPQESTYVCTAPLSCRANQESWETSRLRRKLKKVLWIPIEADPSIPIEQRRIAAPILFSLTISLDQTLKEDWEELMEMLQLGKASELSSHQGRFLQIRPKAAHSRIKKRYLDDEGETQWVVPKGFYLRTQFTRRILKESYCLGRTQRPAEALAKAGEGI